MPNIHNELYPEACRRLSSSRGLPDVQESAFLLVTLKTPNSFCRLSVYENKQTSVRLDVRVEPRLGRGRGKSSKNMTQFRLGPWRTLRKESNWPSASLGRKQTCSSKNPQRQPKAREKKVQDWVTKGGLTCFLNHRLKKIRCWLTK